MRRLSVIDSHTAGEPTRVVVAGGPDLGPGPLAERRERLRRDFDHFRAAVINEPRGSEVMVGAWLVEPVDRECAAGVIFFNNVGVIGMCGHGAIGLVATLAHLKRIGPGDHRIETPVGIIRTTLHGDGSVSLVNVPSWRRTSAVTAEVPGHGAITGDIAWGGNWFFIAEEHGQQLDAARVGQLAAYCAAVRRAINSLGFPDVDHVELTGPPVARGTDGRNFVLCPGGAYDRSPCGTGTSARLACLAADGRLREGVTWVQESIIGSTFSASFRWLDRAAGYIEPRLTGRAHLTAETTLLIDEQDPYRWGIPRNARE